MAESKEIRLDTVKQHNKATDLWVVIENKVYNLTSFRSEHPGGEDSLDHVAGTDATQNFLDVGHSSEAREMMKKYYIGELAMADRKSKLPIRELCIAGGAIILGIATAFVIRLLMPKK